MRKTLLIAAGLICAVILAAPHALAYTNPVIHEDYSDPDVCRVGDDYWMTASSFNCFPGLPILHSCDLVHWTLVGAALESYPGFGFKYNVQHGKGVWAPAIRYHDGWYYIFCGDPDRGVFMVKTQNPRGPWSKPVWVVRQRGFIDPCPFWDEDGSAYLVHAAAGSRAGLKSVIFAAPMAPDGGSLLGVSRVIYDGHMTQPTIEGAKVYKRDGYYYILSPAGGVATGWQTALRSRDIYGPYEEKIVMAWAPGTVNGPHQGAWVDTPSGEDWFLHFQDKGAYGRIVHLQPMRWTDGWPVIGDDPDGDGCGQPVSEAESRGRTLVLRGHNGKGQTMPAHRVPDTEAIYKPYGLDPSWQYPCVPSPYWHFALPDGGVRLYSVQQRSGWQNLSQSGNVLQRRFPAESFTVTARLSFRPNPQLLERCESAGFVVMGESYAGLRLVETLEGAVLQSVSCNGAFDGAEEAVSRDLALLPFTRHPVEHSRESLNVPLVDYPDVEEAVVWVRLEVTPVYDAPASDSPAAASAGAAVPAPRCVFSYSVDGKRFERAGEPFIAVPGRWIGAKYGFWCNRFAPKNDSGWLDVTDLLIR